MQSFPPSGDLSVLPQAGEERRAPGVDNEEAESPFLQVMIKGALPDLAKENHNS